MRTRTMQNMSFHSNVEKILRPKRFIKITDYFTCTSANAINCIICTLCKEVIHRRNRETNRRPIPSTVIVLDVKQDDKTHLNRSRDTLISQIILSNIWQSAAFPYIEEAHKAAKV